MTVKIMHKLALLSGIFFAFYSVKAQEVRGGKTEVPPVVLWGLSVYGGGIEPLAPFDFSEFWNRGVSFYLEGDLLLRNDMVLGLSFGYSRLPMDIVRFSRAKGISAAGSSIQGTAIGIGNMLLSFKGFEDYLLYRYRVGYEMGLGLYSMSNTQVYVEYWGTEVRAVSESLASAVGAFAGISFNFLVSETLQFSIKSRFHYVFLPAMPHQFADLLIGFTLL
ncbi:MAG: hypothetical protein ONB24_09520 [candidate division KSB1 bacterium]|nr:hypothetical protein [candidate division KSB1 bacterium]